MAPGAYGAETWLIFLRRTSCAAYCASPTTRSAPTCSTMAEISSPGRSRTG